MTYAYSYDEENYHGEFATREEAAAEAFAGDEDATHVFTGRHEIPSRVADADAFIDQIAENTVEDAGGDWSDDYLTKIPAEARAELKASLQSAWDQWEAKWKLQPDWFVIRNATVREHTRPVESLTSPA